MHYTRGSLCRSTTLWEQNCKLLKCCAQLSGANLLKWATPPAKLLTHVDRAPMIPGYTWKKNQAYPDIFAVFGCFRKNIFAPGGGAKLLKFALPGGGAKLLKCGGPLKSRTPGCDAPAARNGVINYKEGKTLLQPLANSHTNNVCGVPRVPRPPCRSAPSSTRVTRRKSHAHEMVAASPSAFAPGGRRSGPGQQRHPSEEEGELLQCGEVAA